MAEIRAYFKSHGAARAALSELRGSGLGFELKGLKVAGPPEQSMAETMLPPQTVSSTELTGTNMAVFPLVGGRAMMRLDHSVENRETELLLEADAAVSGQLRRLLRDNGARL